MLRLLLPANVMPPCPFPISTETLLDVALPTTRSFLPSPSMSPEAMHREPVPPVDTGGRVTYRGAFGHTQLAFVRSTMLPEVAVTVWR